MPPAWKSEHVRQTLTLLGHIEGHLRRIEHTLAQLVHQEEQTMATIADLQTEVGQNTSVTESAVALLNGLSQQLKDALAANDPAAIQAVVDQLDANTSALAEAVTQNTAPPSDGNGGPAVEEPAPAPEPEPTPEPEPEA